MNPENSIATLALEIVCIGSIWIKDAFRQNKI